MKFENYFEIEVGAYPETHPEAVSQKMIFSIFAKNVGWRERCSDTILF